MTCDGSSPSSGSGSSHRLPGRDPQPLPKGTVAVWDDRHLVFADLRSPRTIHNLRRNPAVEINVVDPVARTGYRFKGEASVITGGPLFERAVAFFAEDGLIDASRRIRAVVVVAVRHAAPLVSPAYDLGLSEQAIRARWQRHYTPLEKAARLLAEGAWQALRRPRR